MGDPPQITVAIPLHQSRPWVENVYENVRRLPPAVTEIIVSDRTCLDDSAPVLAARLADDRRVTAVVEPVGLSWGDHYQRLLENAAGDLFMWMPHDDIFDSSWVPTLAGSLESHPTAWLAFGRMDRVQIDGVTPMPQWEYREPEPGLIEGRDVLRRAGDGTAFRGLFRRREVLDAGIRLESVGRYPAIDLLWLLAVGLRSGIVFDDRTSNRKRYHDTNTHTQWRIEPGDYQRSALEVIRHHGPDGVAGAAMRMRTRAELAVELGPRWLRQLLERRCRQAAD